MASVRRRHILELLGLMRKVELGTCNRHAELYHLSVISEATLGASYVRLSQKLDIQG